MRTIKASEIIHDPKVYPRKDVDKAHVETLYQIMQAGVALPPLVICQKTRRIVDGVHRLYAAIRRKGPEAGVEVVEKQYRNDGELLLDAIRYNAKHGRPLRDDDRRLCARIGSEAGLKIDDIASVLGVRASAIGELSVSRPSTILSMATGLKPQSQPAAETRYQDDDDDDAPAPARQQQQRPAGNVSSLIERIANQRPSRGSDNGRNRNGSQTLGALEQGIVSAAVEWYESTPAREADCKQSLMDAVERYLKAQEKYRANRQGA